MRHSLREMLSLRNVHIHDRLALWHQSCQHVTKYGPTAVPSEKIDPSLSYGWHCKYFKVDMCENAGVKVPSRTLLNYATLICSLLLYIRFYYVILYYTILYHTVTILR